MTPADRAQLQVVVAQVATLKEQAIALGMMAESLDRVVQALTAGEPEPTAPEPPVIPKPKYFNSIERPIAA